MRLYESGNPQRCPVRAGSIGMRYRQVLDFIDSQGLEVFSIVAFSQLATQRHQLMLVDKAEIEGDFFGAGYLETLAMFERAHEFGCLQQ